jgi:D-arabinose 1-dehydrogenase-like Zn-dependent alcohol dehydrogenase
MPTVYPIVPGHEIVGRVTKVGPAVTKFKSGDLAAVGCLVESDGTCPQCVRARLCSFGLGELFGSTTDPGRRPELKNICSNRSIPWIESGVRSSR